MPLRYYNIATRSAKRTMANKANSIRMIGGEKIDVPKSLFNGLFTGISAKPGPCASFARLLEKRLSEGMIPANNEIERVLHVSTPKAIEMHQRIIRRIQADSYLLERLAEALGKEK